MVKISPEKIEEIREASDIVQVVSGYLTLQHRGKNYFGLCPFHQEKTPSFSVNPAMQIFHCFGCGAGGNVFTFVMRMEKLSFPEAARQLAQAAGIIIPEDDEDVDKLRHREALIYVHKTAQEFYQHILLDAAEAEAARQYLGKRGLDKEAIKRFDLGYAPDEWDSLLKLSRKKGFNPDLLHQAGLVVERKEGGGYYDRFRGRITFAIHNQNGHIIAFGARRIVEDDSPKYINSPESDIYQKRFVLYGLVWARQAIREKDQVIIVEGYTDVMSLHLAGIGNAVSTSGTSLTEEHARVLRRYTRNAMLLYDSDSAGAAAALRGADILMENGMEVKIADLPAGQDPDDFCRQNGSDALEQLFSNAQSLLDFKLQRLEAENKLATAAQRAEATRELLAFIHKVNDTIQQSFLVTELSKKLKIDEGVLWNEMARFRVRRPSPLQSDEKKSDDKDYHQTKRGAAEFSLLSVILNAPELADRIIAVIPHNRIRHREIASILQRIDNDILYYGRFQPQSYIATISDPVLAQYITQYLEQKNIEILKKQAIDCIVRLNMVHVEEQMRQVRNQMRQDRSETLMAKYRELIIQKRHVEKRTFINEKEFFE
jgi:DNA primase